MKVNCKKGEGFIELIGAIIGIAIVIGALTVFERGFDIPKKPETQKAIVEYGDATYYHVTHDEVFSGFVKKLDGSNEMYCTIRNKGRNALQIKDLSHFLLWTKDDKSYSVKIVNQMMPDNSIEGMLDPGEQMSLILKISDSFPYDEQIRGFNVWITKNRAIRFGYSKLDWYDQLRWWLAEEFSETDSE